MKNDRTQKLALAGVFCALAVVGSLFSFPVFGSKCAPVQHMVNVLCGVLLGPGYSVGVAFTAALLRNLLGLGSLLAFPGGMCGALLCGLAYRRTHSLPAALLGEVFGTSVLGGGHLPDGAKRCQRCLLRLYLPLPGLHGGGRHHLGGGPVWFEAVACSAADDGPPLTKRGLTPC